MLQRWSGSLLFLAQYRQQDIMFFYFSYIILFYNNPNKFHKIHYCKIYFMIKYILFTMMIYKVRYYYSMQMESQKQCGQTYDIGIQNAFIKSAQIQFQTDIPFSNHSSLHLSYMGTFIIVHTNQVSGKKIFKVRHISDDGNFIKEIDLGILTYARVHMMKQEYTIIETFDSISQDYCLLQWNLHTDQKIHIRCGRGWFNDVYLFSKTNLICVVQRINPKSKILHSHSQIHVKVSYFQFPFISQGNEPIHVLMPQQIDFLTYWDVCYQINSHSSLAWIKQKPSHRYDLPNVDYLVIHILDLKESKKIKTFKLLLQLASSNQLMSMYISDIWEMTPGQIYIKCEQFLSSRKWKQLNIVVGNQLLDELLSKQKTFNLVWTYKQGLVRNAKFNSSIMKNDHSYFVQFLNQLRPIPDPKKYNLPIDFMGFKNSYSIHRASKFLLHYVSPTSQSHLHTSQHPLHTPNLPSLNFNYRISPHFNPSLFISYKAQSLIKQINKTNYQINVCKVTELEYHWKIMLAFLMEESISNCDDDLIWYVVQMGSFGVKEKIGGGWFWKVEEGVLN